MNLRPLQVPLSHGLTHHHQSPAWHSLDIPGDKPDLGRRSTKHSQKTKVVELLLWLPAAKPCPLLLPSCNTRRV